MHTVDVSEITLPILYGTGSYLLIDPMLGEPLPDIQYEPDQDLANIENARAQAWQRETFTVQLSSPIPLRQAQFPYLVELNGPSDPWWEISLNLAVAQRKSCREGGLTGTGGGVLSIGGWLSSACRTSELLNGLADLFHLNLPRVTRASYLRLADPRVLDWTLQVLGRERLSAAIAPIQRWATLDACGKLIELNTSSSPSHKLDFSPGEWKLMERGEHVHRTINILLGQADMEEPAAGPKPYDSVVRALDSTDLAAKRWPYRFPQPRDKHIWAALSLLRGAIDQSPAVQRLMELNPQADEPPESVSQMALPLVTATHANGAAPR